MNVLPRLYAIADAALGDPVELAQSLFAGGAKLVQVRHKEADSRVLLAEVEQILAGAPNSCAVLVNDRADIALLTGAAGVHLGQNDLAPDAARRVLKPGQLIGRSTHNLEQALAADQMEVNYIAVGPVFPTTSKSNPDPVIGLDDLRRICARVHKPVVAIGGISLETAKDVLDCGAESVAVIGDLLRHGNIAKRTAEWVRHLEY